jgi:hypothetical protein
MSDNKLLNIQEWKTVATSSTPSSGFSKIYPRSSSQKWYIIDDAGNEKEISFALSPSSGLNGINLTLLTASNVYGYELGVALGDGLTFSGNFQGSTISVVGLKPSNLSYLGTASVGYVLSATGSNGFNWIPFTAPGISGQLNRIAKFDSTSSIASSLIGDDGTIVVIGVTPSFVSVTFSVGGSLNISGNVYLSDDINTYINNNSGFNFNTAQNFIINKGSYNYLSFNFDNINSYSTFSMLNNLIEIGDKGTFSKYISIPNVGTVSIGTTSSRLSTYLYSNVGTVLTLNSNGNNGALKIVDGTQSQGKVFVSDADGLGSWAFIKGVNGITVSGITISSDISGYGLTLSGNSLTLNYNIFGTSLTYSVLGVVNLATSSVVVGTYGSTNSIPQISVDAYGRITNVTNIAISGGSGGTNSSIFSPYDKGWTSLSVVSNNSTASNSTISYTPIQGSYVSVFVNGQEMQVGNATTSVSCYFGTNSYTPKGFSQSNAIQSGDYLYWNPTYAGFNLEAGYRISLHYLIST